MTSATSCIATASELGVTAAISFTPPLATSDAAGQERAIKVREFLQGSILARKGSDGSIDFSQRLAVVAPAPNNPKDIRSDCIMIFEDDGKPTQTSDLLTPSTIRLKSLSERFAVIIPGAWARAEGDERPPRAFPLHFSDDSVLQVHCIKWQVNPPSLRLAYPEGSGVPGGTLNSDVRSVLRGIEVSRLAPVDWNGDPLEPPGQQQQAMHAS